MTASQSTMLCTANQSGCRGGRGTSNRRLLPSLAVCASILAAPGAAQDRLGRGVADLSEVVDVNLVNVDVLATDKQGRPVSGLHSRDFELFDNDRRTEVTHLFAIAAEEPRLSERLSVIVLFDVSHLSVASRDAVLPELGLARGLGGWRVAVAG